jgi:hypothetical protein
MKNKGRAQHYRPQTHLSRKMQTNLNLSTLLMSYLDFLKEIPPKAAKQDQPVFNSSPRLP